MTEEKLNEIVASHGRWLVDKSTGERANLSSADLRGAKLGYADLSGADLSSADLRGANLGHADLRCAILPAIILQVGPIGSRKDYIVYNASDDNIRCGCWNDYKGGTLEEFEARVEEVYPSEKKDTLKFRNEYLAVIGYFKTVGAEARKMNEMEEDEA